MKKKGHQMEYYLKDSLRTVLTATVGAFLGIYLYTAFTIDVPFQNKIFSVFFTVFLIVFVYALLNYFVTEKLKQRKVFRILEIAFLLMALIFLMLLKFIR